MIKDALEAIKRQSDFAAIQEGINDMNAGRVRPWTEVKEELRQKFDFKGA